MSDAADDSAAAAAAGCGGQDGGPSTSNTVVAVLSVGPPANQGPDDSGMMDDNELTTGLLNSNSNYPGEDDGDDGVGGRISLSRLAADAWNLRLSTVKLIMRKIGNFVASFTLMAMLLLVPTVLYRALSQKRVDAAAFHSAGVLVLGTVILSIRLVYLHFTHWYMPSVQKYVVRILWMVPLYAVGSWLSLYFHHARIYIDTIRDLYEAYVIASFVYYLIELLGGEESIVRILRHKVREDPTLASHLGGHPFPLHFVLEPWELGVEFLLQCKGGTLQYVVIKTVATILTYIFQSLGVLGEGQFNWNVAFPYLTILMNMSVMYALYCLVKLFHAVNDELRHPIDWHPLGKFLCIKGVVFFTWWQGVLIFYLKAHGIITDSGSWSGNEVAYALIDYCICVEMVGFAIAHSFTFTYKEYLPSTIEEAMSNYEYEQVAAASNEVGGNGNSNGGSSGGPAYQPPETLPRPLKFKDAFWSSTLPSEIGHDIRRLQNGVDNAVNQIRDPGTISLQDILGNEEDGSDERFVINTRSSRRQHRIEQQRV